MCATKLTPIFALSLLLLFYAGAITSNAAAADSSTSEDFGPYSSNPEQEVKQHLEALGDWGGSDQNIDQAINKFYNRTKLTASDDIIQQLLDIDMVISAEREAKRALDGNGSESMQAYAYTIAPWLKPEVPKPEVPKPEEPEQNDMLAERSVLTSAISSLNSALEDLSGIVDILY